MNKRGIRSISKSNGGFSLLEIVVSLSILAATIYIGAVSFNGLAPRYQLKRAAWEIRSRIFYVRTRSAFEGTPFRLRFEPWGFAVERYNDEGNEWKVMETRLLEGVSVEANNTPTFHPQGTVSDLATINISNAKGRYKITLAMSGRVNVVKMS